MRRLLGAVLAASIVVGCRGQEAVTRVVGDEIMVGSFIGADAYTAFLLGALAEEDKNLELAARAYRQAARDDARNPEAHARLAIVRCRVRAVAEGQAAAARALELDPRNATAEEARAICAAAEAGGDVRASRTALTLAAALDPTDAKRERDLAIADAAGGDIERARARLEAWVLTNATHPSVRMAAAQLAWRARRPLRAAELAESAVVLSASFAPSAAKLAAELATGGALQEARKLSAALLDLGPIGAAGHGRVATTLGSEPLVPRLAVDEALLRGDFRRAEARATKGGLRLGDVVGRAILLGTLEPARALVPLLEESSPFEAVIARAALGENVKIPSSDASVAASLALAFAARAEVILDRARMNAVLERLPPIAFDPSDAVLVRAAAAMTRKQ
jgi:hypothetical protein